MELLNYKKQLINKKKKFLNNKIKKINQNFRRRSFMNNYQFNKLNKIRKNKIRNIKRRINEQIKFIRGMNRLPQKKGLLIGINYTGSYNELYGCINDTIDVSNVLKQKGYEIIFINDNSEIKPTKENILNSIKELLQNSYYGDKLVLYYSGHGSQIRDYNNEEIDNKDEIIITYDEKYISDDEFQILLNENMKKGVKINIFMDCCNSGTQFDLKYVYKPKWKVNKNYKNINGNVIMISGCRDNEVSYEAYINNKNSGAFTFTLLKYINNNFNYNKLMNIINKQLKKNYFNQKPQLSSNYKFNLYKHKMIL